MKTWTALKANGLRGKPVESVKLVIDEEIECATDGSMTLEQCEHVHIDNAHCVMAALASAKLKSVAIAAPMIPI